MSKIAMRRFATLAVVCLAWPAYAQPVPPSAVAPRPASGDGSDPCGCGDNLRCKVLCGNPGSGGGSGGIGSGGGTGGIGTQRELELMRRDLTEGNRSQFQSQRKN
jgi:hypothetical protein